MTLAIGVIDVLVNRDGYGSPPGVETKDSAGESSNFTTGVEAGFSQDAIVSTIVWGA
jgi:hypothetical protein